VRGPAGRCSCGHRLGRRRKLCEGGASPSLSVFHETAKDVAAGIALHVSAPAPADER